MESRRSLLALVLPLAVASGCAMTPARSVSIANDTSHTVVLVVNGEKESVVLPHQSITIPASHLDPGDWFVEGHLSRVEGMPAIGVFMPAAPDSTQQLGPAVLLLVDRGVVWLSCGSIAIWTGARPVETPGPSAPGDCTD